MLITKCFRLCVNVFWSAVVQYEIENGERNFTKKNVSCKLPERSGPATSPIATRTRTSPETTTTKTETAAETAEQPTTTTTSDKNGNPEIFLSHNVLESPANPKEAV